jgi:hypothetical protein
MPKPVVESVLLQVVSQMSRDHCRCEELAIPFVARKEGNWYPKTFPRIEMTLRPHDRSPVVQLTGEVHSGNGSAQSTKVLKASQTSFPKKA